MATFKIIKNISALPNLLESNTLYFIRVGEGFDLYCSDITGSIAHKVNISDTLGVPISLANGSGWHKVIRFPIDGFLFVDISIYGKLSNNSNHVISTKFIVFNSSVVDLIESTYVSSLNFINKVRIISDGIYNYIEFNFPSSGYQDLYFKFSKINTGTENILYYTGILPSGETTTVPTFDFLEGKNNVWTSYNDGSGSGLDADLLDGFHANQFAKGSNKNIISYPSSGWYRIGRFQTGERGIAEFTIFNAGGSFAPDYLSVRLFKNWTSRVLAEKIVCSNSNVFSSIRVVQDSSASISYIEVFFNTNTPIVMCLNWLEQSSTNSSGSANYNFTYYTGSLPASDPNNTIIKSYNLSSNGIYSDLDYKISSNSVWHGGNDGSGSGLDADLLDGLQATQFARLSTVPTTSTSTGSTGQIAYDTDYLYICTATNTWKRISLLTW